MNDQRDGCSECAQKGGRWGGGKFHQVLQKGGHGVDIQNGMKKRGRVKRWSGGENKYGRQGSRQKHEKATSGFSLRRTAIQTKGKEKFRETPA